MLCLLTDKLSGRAQAHPARRERTISSSARGAPAEDFHGPLERLLEDAFIAATVRALSPWRKLEAWEAVTSRAAEPVRAHNGCLKPRVFGSNSQFFLTFKMSRWLRPLTVKLRGRPEAPIKRSGRTLSSRSRGA